MKKIAIIMMITLIAIAMVPAAYAQQVTVTRDIPDSVALDTPINITLNVDIIDEQNKPGTYILSEYIPVGLELDEEGLNYDSFTREIRWLVIEGLIGEVEDTTYTYTVQTSIPVDYEIEGVIELIDGIYDTQGDTLLALAPEEDIILPVVGQISPTAAAVDAAQTYSVPVSDNVGVASCNLYVDGVDAGEMDLSETPCASCTASKSYTFTNEGYYPVYARCTDTSENSANGTSVTVDVTLIGDTESPVVGVVSPATATTNVAQTYSASVSDNGEVMLCSLYVNGAYAGDMELSETPCADCTASISYTFADAGSYPVYAECYDAFENPGAGTPVSVIAADLPEDTTAPVISNVQSTGITTSSATISWSTNEAGNSVVEYGTTTSYGFTQTNPAMTTSHSISLSGLLPSTTYHYRVKSTDESENTGVSEDYTFTTNIFTNEQLSVSRDLPSIAGANSPINVELTVDVNENNKPSLYILSEAIPEGFTVVSTDGGSYDDVTRTLEWRVVTYVEDKTYTYTIETSSQGIYSLSGTVELLSGTYSVTGETVLNVGAGGGGDDPQDETAPVISGVSAPSVSSTSALITWMTDETSTSVVEYGETTAYGDILTNTNLVLSHSMPLSGLTASTAYHYRVKSVDASGNPAISADYTFTTTETSSYPITNNVEVLDSARMPASGIQAGALCHIRVASTNEDTIPVISTQIVEIMDGLTPVYILTMQSTINAGGTDTNTYGFNVPADAQPGKVYTVKVFSWDKLMSEGIPQIQAAEKQASFTVE